MQHQIPARDGPGVVEDKEAAVRTDVDDFAGNGIAAVKNDDVGRRIVNGAPVVASRQMMVIKAVVLSAVRQREEQSDEG